MATQRSSGAGKMPSRDPRTYVKAVPLPIASQKGLLLQARSERVYNPTSPNRDQVRKWNYDRRIQQMNDQGFYAYNYKPYRGLGDPFYLDEKKLILHSLGQWDENQEWESSSSSEDEEDNGPSAVICPQATMTAAKFVLRRTRKDLNTLRKEVVQGRNLIRNVRLGHGLFDLIKQERMAKKAAAVAEKQKSLEEARNQWQRPKDSSSEDESDEDLDKDEDLENFFGPNISDSHSADIEMASTPGQGMLDSRSHSAKTQSSGKKKKQASPRPFTPQHTNLAEVNEYKEDMSKDALFRQLCALNWILDAMNIEQGCIMGPISTCWSHLEIGGTKISAKRVREEKKAEADWERWLTNQQMGRVSKKGSVTRLNRLSRVSRLTSHPRVSLPSTSISPSSSSSQVNASTGQSTLGAKDATLEDRMAPSPQNETEDEETLHRTGIFKFLDEYYDSLRREAQKEEEAQGGGVAEGSSPTTEGAQNVTIEEGGEVKPKKSREGRSSKKNHDRQRTPERHPRFDSPEERSRSKFTLKDLRNDYNYRPKSSAELIEFHANKPSNRYINLRQDLHNKFKEVHDDKAMTLHDILEQMERERLTKCQNKFSCLQTKSMSFHRAIDSMRREGERMISRPEEVRRQSSFRGNWYTDLIQGIHPDIKVIWYYRSVLQKLGKYGLVTRDEDGVENTSKQSVYKFLKVLGGLRHWEICCPDVAAAIEFCRARIVDMSVEEFEEWFSQAFPRVLRPSTAPAGGLRLQGGQAQAQGEGGQVAVPAGKGGEAKGTPSSTGRLSIASRGAGAKSSVSVANGTDGKMRLVQSAKAGVRRR